MPYLAGLMKSGGGDGGGFRFRRVQAFLDPWSYPSNEGYQMIQSLYAIGSGGLFGVGLRRK